MAGYLVEASELTAFADTIRAINLTSSEHLLQWPSNFINEIRCFSDELIMYESAWSKMLSFITSSVPSYYFYSCNYLPSNIVLSQCENIHTYAFGNCITIESVSLPECSIINASAFFECTSLTTIYAPKCKEIEEEAFVNTKLSIASFPACTYIGADVFSRCQYLQSLYLMGSSVVYTNTGSTGFPTTSTFKIYVPASLLNSYQTSSNWSLWSHKLVGI